MRSPSRFALLTAGVLGFCASAQAATLQLDFGSQELVPASRGAVSPAHAKGAVPLSETTWNQVQSSDIASGLSYSNGSAATGVAINLGHEEVVGNNILNFALPNAINTASLTGTASSTLGSIYAVTNSESVVERYAAADGIFRNLASSGTGDNMAVGLRIDGLAAGQYELYYVGRNTNTTDGARAIGFYTSVGAAADTFDFGSLSSVNLSNANLSGNTSWTAGNQFNSTTVTLSNGQSIFIAAEGLNTKDLRGFINTVQVVAVPEPGSVALVVVGAGLLGLRRRRR